jgi:hypothetical protein
MPLEEACDLYGELRVPILLLPYPSGRVLGKSQTGMIGCRDPANDAVDRADFKPRTGFFCAVRKHGAGRMRMSEDQQPVATIGSRDFTRVFGTLMGLSATSRRLDHHERDI